jgi:hypothetical protein
VFTAILQLQGGLNTALRAYRLGDQQQQHQQLLSSTSDEGAIAAATDDKATTKAIISKPLDVVPAEPSTTSGLTSVVLDGSSSTAQTGAIISTAAWSIIKVSDKSNVANATGLVASVLLPPGQYQAGLLVLDSLLGSNIALQQFEVMAEAGRH